MLVTHCRQFAVQVGFEMRKITKGRVNMKVWDVGGQPRFRSMWERYCRGVNAIVYVVDSADLAKIDEARKLLHDLMQRPSLQDIPLLVLGNKNDLDQALTAADLTAQMQLQARPTTLRGILDNVPSVHAQNLARYSASSVLRLHPSGADQNKVVMLRWR